MAGSGFVRKAGICSTFLTGGEIVCKGACELAAGTMSCCQSPVIQNDYNQIVEKMVKGEKSLKMKDTHLKDLVSTQHVLMHVCLPSASGLTSFSAGL